MDTDSAKSGSRAFSWREAGGGGRSHILPYAGGERQYMGKSISHSPVLGSIVGKSRSFEPTHDPRWRSFTEEQAKAFRHAAARTNQRIVDDVGKMHTTNQRSSKKCVKSFMRSHKDIVAEIVRKNHETSRHAAAALSDSVLDFLSPVPLEVLRQRQARSPDKQHQKADTSASPCPSTSIDDKGPYDSQIPLITPVASFTGVHGEVSELTMDIPMHDHETLFSAALGDRDRDDSSNSARHGWRAHGTNASASPTSRKSDLRQLKAMSLPHIGMPGYIGNDSHVTMHGENCYEDSDGEASRPISPARRAAERKLPKSIMLANANRPEIVLINPIGISRKRLQAIGVPVPRFSMVRTPEKLKGLTIGTASPTDMISAIPHKSSKRKEAVVYRWQQQPIQHPISRPWSRELHCSASLFNSEGTQGWSRPRSPLAHSRKLQSAPAGPNLPL